MMALKAQIAWNASKGKLILALEPDLISRRIWLERHELLAAMGLPELSGTLHSSS